jgi:hypothetical protein
MSKEDRVKKRVDIPEVKQSLDGGEDGKEKSGPGIYRLDGGEDGKEKSGPGIYRLDGGEDGKEKSGPGIARRRVATERPRPVRAKKEPPLRKIS